MRKNEKVIKEISVGNVNIPISAKYIGDYEIDDIKDMIDDSKYTLPTATSSTLGGVKIGSNISVSSGTISLSKSNVTSALGYTPPTTNTTYSVATESTDGLMPKEVVANMGTTALIDVEDATGTVTQATDKVSVSIETTIQDKNYITGTIDEDTFTTSFAIPQASTGKAGVMSSADKTKLDGIAVGANKYTLPNATSSTLGGVKIGSNISVSSGTISLTKSNVTSALGYTPPTTNTTYSVATKSTDGLLSKSIYSRMMGPSGWIITGFQDDPISITQAADNVKLNFNLSANREKLGDGDTDDDSTVSTGSTTIPVATTSKAGVMSAADKTKLNGLSKPWRGHDGMPWGLIGDFGGRINLAEFEDYLVEGGLYLIETEETSDIDGYSQCAALFIYRFNKPLVLINQHTGYMSLSFNGPIFDFDGSNGPFIDFDGSNKSGCFTLREVHTTELTPVIE